jgi:large subunit ribosomal protein L29
MKANELRQQSADELQRQLLELRKEQFNLRMQQGSNQLTRPSRMRAVRREIARVKTVMGEAARQMALSQMSMGKMSKDATRDNAVAGAGSNK